MFHSPRCGHCRTPNEMGMDEDGTSMTRTKGPNISLCFGLDFIHLSHFIQCQFFQKKSVHFFVTNF